MSQYQDIILPPGLAAGRPAASHEGRLYYSTDTPILERDTGAAWEQYAPTGGAGAGLYVSYYAVWDQKPQNTAGGAFNAGAWRTRDLNQETDPDGIGALAANQIVLDAGTYRCIISAPAYFVQVHQTRLYNVTGAAVLLTGTSEVTWNTVGSGGRPTRSFVVGRFTVVGAQSLEVQHRCGANFASGFGSACNFTVEIYTVAEFFKET